MAIMSSRLIRQQIGIEELRKMGAKVISLQGVMFYVKFKVKDTRIEYLFNIRPDNSYFLERIKPYAMPAGQFKNIEDLIEIIKIDLEQFKNASNSSNFPEFIEIDASISKLVRYFEDLYLYYNIPKEDLKTIKDEVNTIVKTITEIKNKSERVYHKKDPDSLKNI